MLRARLVAFLASLLMLWPVGTPTHARYFCRMMERVMDTCCCPRKSALEALHSEAQAQSPDCCVRLTQGSMPAADSRRDLATPSTLTALLPANALGVSPSFQREVLELHGVEEDAVLARGPPLFLKHCVFLI
jgi:hypothetical protein